MYNVVITMYKAVHSFIVFVEGRCYPMRCLSL